MDSTTAVLLAAPVLLAVGVSVFCFAQMRRQSAALQICLEENAELKRSVNAGEEKIAALSLKTDDLARVTAWLETRSRERRPAAENLEAETVRTDALKSSITERRHRVLSLAELGQNPESIAATLGMLSGEVELILNLNRAA